MNEIPGQDRVPVAPRALKLLVIGIGGAGGNLAAHLQLAGLGDAGFLAVNTDAQALANVPVAEKLLLGGKSMRGLGAGGELDRGRQAAEESREELQTAIGDADLVFIMAGMGGGTGTGAAPVIARLGRESGALVLAFATLPFTFEGSRRRELAEQGLVELREAADGVIVLPNQKILSLVPETAPLPECFGLMHDYLSQGVRGIARLITEPGMINVDFNDLAAVLRSAYGASALAHLEIPATSSAAELLERVQQHPLLDEGQVLTAARSLLVSLTCGPEVSIHEVNRVMATLESKAPGALINFGAAVSSQLPGRIGITLVVGLDAAPPSATAESSSESSARGRRRNRREEKSNDGLDTEYLSKSPAAEPYRQRFVPPPPTLTGPQAVELLGKRPGNRGFKGRRHSRAGVQGTLPLEVISKGRFEKSEPTLHAGQNLDEPTYIRRGVVLN